MLSFHIYKDIVIERTMYRQKKAAKLSAIVKIICIVEKPDCN